MRKHSVANALSLLPCYVRRLKLKKLQINTDLELLVHMCTQLYVDATKRAYCSAWSFGLWISFSTRRYTPRA